MNRATASERLDNISQAIIQPLRGRFGMDEQLPQAPLAVSAVAPALAHPGVSETNPLRGFHLYCHSDRSEAQGGKQEVDQHYQSQSAAMTDGFP